MITNSSSARPRHSENEEEEDQDSVDSLLSPGEGKDRLTARNLPWQKIFHRRIAPICVSFAEETSITAESVSNPSQSTRNVNAALDEYRRCGRHLTRLGGEMVLVTAVRDARKPPPDLTYGQVTLAIEDLSLDSGQARASSEGIYLVREIAACPLGPSKQSVNERLFMDRKRENFKAKGWGTGRWRVWLALEDVDAQKKKRKKAELAVATSSAVISVSTSSSLPSPGTKLLQSLKTPLNATTSGRTNLKRGFSVEVPNSKRAKPSPPAPERALLRSGLGVVIPRIDGFSAAPFPMQRATPSPHDAALATMQMMQQQQLRQEQYARYLNAMNQQQQAALSGIPTSFRAAVTPSFMQQPSFFPRTTSLAGIPFNASMVSPAMMSVGAVPMLSPQFQHVAAPPAALFGHAHPGLLPVSMGDAPGLFASLMQHRASM